LPFYLPGQEFDIKFEGIVAKENYVAPTIELELERSSRRKKDETPEANTVCNLELQISIKRDEYCLTVIGNARSESLQQTWKTDPPEHKSSLTFRLMLDNYTLSQIERIRHGNSLSLEFYLQFQAFVEGNPAAIQQYKIPLKGITIPKSTWVEDILPRLNYKNVALVEIPKLEYKKLNEAINTLNLAWKSYSMGDVDDVLVKCRKTLESVGNQVKKQGFIMEVNKTDNQGNPYKAKYPDWKRFFDSESKAGVVKGIVQKMFDFVAPGAHVGGLLEMNHAYFALLQAFSLTHLVISRFKMIENNRQVLSD
jgi:hypothetical protein